MIHCIYDYIRVYEKSRELQNVNERQTVRATANLLQQKSSEEFN
jgi:hypothetical protein